MTDVIYKVGSGDPVVLADQNSPVFIETADEATVTAWVSRAGKSAQAGAPAASEAKAAGGTITEDSAYVYHRFEEDGAFEALEALTVDVFLVGGGAGGASNNRGGGGGGYTHTETSVAMMASDEMAIVVGQGGAGGPYSGGAGAPGNAGSDTTATFGAAVFTAGGAPAMPAIVSAQRRGGSGGSGGASGTTGGLAPANGGSDGGDGGASGTYIAGEGQGTTTRAFGETEGELFSGGGGNGAPDADIPVGQGGAGGGGAGGTWVGEVKTAGSQGQDGKGGGGGGGADDNAGGRGGHGCVIVRYAKT